MTHTSDEWAQHRGQRWIASLDGIEAMLAPIDEPLIDRLLLDRPLRVADIGCGGGATARAILARSRGSEVHGFDISAAAIEAINDRAPGIQGHVANVETEVPDGAFDRLCSRFGIMFFDEPRKAFENLHGWLEAGGLFAFAVWASPEDNPWMTTVRDAVASVAPLPAPVPDQPGPFRYANIDALLTLLEKAKFKSLKAVSWRGRLPIGGQLAASAAARFALDSFATFSEILETAGPEATREAHRRLSEHFAPHEKGGAVLMEARAHIVTGLA
ncbi:MAG: class I SAM-dependent methyltransferase [Myxococcota bacterium]